MIVRIAWLHVVGLFGFGLVAEQSWSHALLDVAPIAVAAGFASWSRLSRQTRSVWSALSVVGASAVLTHLAGGYIEAHFHFFIAVAVLSLYQEWEPFLCALAVTVVHHGFLGTIDPSAVFNHPAAQQSPWKWAVIHAAFVLAASAASVVAWRWNEDARNSLANAEARFRSLVQRSSDLTIVSDADGIITYASPASEPLLGVRDADLIGRALDTLVHPDDKPALKIRLDAAVQLPVATQLRLVHADGTARRVEATVTNLVDDPIVEGFVLNVRDLSDRFRLETELRHAQKLESVGLLAAGIAHEINTPIQFVGDNVRFLQEAIAGYTRVVDAARDPAGCAEATHAIAVAADIDYFSAEVPSAIEQSLEGIDRVATIVRAMKAFGHPGDDEASPTDLNEIVRNTLIVANNEVKRIADVQTDLADLPSVTCHGSDMNQVVLNLVVNAAHAIGTVVGDTGRRGRIVVRTFADGDDAVIEVTDTGCGIPPDIADRVFDAFFTTKPVGQGTGQGLSVAYHLLTERNHGSIDFESTPGSGTTFSVRLPLSSDDGNRPPFVPTGASAQTEGGGFGGSERKDVVRHG